MEIEGMDTKDVIERISYFRTKQKLSARELSLIIGKSESYINRLETQKDKIYQELVEQCEKLSQSRKKSGKILQKELKQALKDLNFLAVEFEISINSDSSKITSEGYDTVDFMISLNPGEPRKSISKVASGGELSRIMLALKAVMADKEKIDTMIFDEIDAGISGKTAWKVSEKMAVLGKAHQLICITHLPQIAAMADSHFMIEKNTIKGRSVTEITEIKEDKSLEEIARLLSGTEVTETVLNNAKELKELAKKAKNI